MHELTKDYVKDNIVRLISDSVTVRIPIRPQRSHLRDRYVTYRLRLRHRPTISGVRRLNVTTVADHSVGTRPGCEGRRLSISVAITVTTRRCKSFTNIYVLNTRLRISLPNIGIFMLTMQRLRVTSNDVVYY